jgi:hypothetical protein
MDSLQKIHHTNNKKLFLSEVCGKKLIQWTQQTTFDDFTFRYNHSQLQKRRILLTNRQRKISEYPKNVSSSLLAKVAIIITGKYATGDNFFLNLS